MFTLQLAKISKKISTLNRILRSKLNYPFTGFIENYLITCNGKYSRMYELKLQSTELMGDEDYSQLITSWENIIQLCEIQVIVRDCKYFILVSNYNLKQLEIDCLNIRNKLDMQGIELQITDKISCPDILEESIVGNYVKINEEGKVSYSRYIYVDTLPTVVPRFMDDLQYYFVDHAIYINYSQIEKKNFVKKINKAHKDSDYSEEKNISETYKQQFQLDNSIGNLGENMNSTIQPVGMRVIIELKAKSLEELDEISNKINISGYKFNHIWGQQIETLLDLSPFSHIRLLRDISFDNWANIISFSMPFMRKTMHFSNELPIGDNYSSPIPLVASKSMFMIGRTRMGKTYLAKKLINHLLSLNYDIQVIDRLLDTPDPDLDYSDCSGITRWEVDYNDTQKFLSICDNIFNNQKKDYSKNTLIIVDEAWQFIQESKEIRDVIQKIARDGSKFKLGIFFITQSIRDLTILAELGVIEQIGVRIFLGLPGKIAEKLCQDEFHLPDEAISIIQCATQGEAIIQTLGINKKYNAIDYAKII